MNPAFETAVQDDRIRKNPCNFSVVDIIPNNKTERKALTQSQKESFLVFIKEGRFSYFYDEAFTLFETGMRVSEMCGLTLQDIDFNGNRIHICKQLLYNYKTGERYIGKPKSASGERYLPMTAEIKQAFQRVIAKIIPFIIRRILRLKGP